MAAGLFGEIGFALIAGPSTSFGGIIPDVVVDEVARDALIITDHPVERGAAITDHAFKRPTILEMRVGFSNSSAGAEGYVDAIEEELRVLQARREPFEIFTPRRRYRNMLVESIIAPRDEKNANARILIVSFRQIIITSTKQAANAANSASPASNTSDQAMPQTTGGVTDAGSQQLQAPQAGSDAFGSTFSLGSNTDFTGAPAGSGLVASGADADTGDFVFSDGTTVPGGAAAGAQGGAPSDLGGNIGMFGSYGPNAFRGSYAPGAFGR